MSFYPFYSELQEVSQKFSKGNFSLWFNKIIFEVDDKYEKEKSHILVDKDNWAENILEKYKEISKKEIKKLLDKKHKAQNNYCTYLSNSNRYKLVTFEAKLKSDLIIGLGESHPTELGMILDHNLGVSYIPASTIKGAVRFSYSLNYIDNNKDLPTKEEYIKEEKKYITVLKEKDTPITKLFGGDNLLDNNNYVDKRGKIIFLDSYSKKVPELKLDVMTPHYGDYYKDNKTAPADNQDPNPLKFLVIKRGEIFIFNILIDNSIINEKENIILAFKRALEVEGVGAKTSIGYGRFEVEVKEVKTEKELHKEKVDNFISKLIDARFNKDSIFNEWQNKEELKNEKEIAEKILELKLVKPRKRDKSFSNNFKKTAKILKKTPEELEKELHKEKNDTTTKTTIKSTNDTDILDNKRKSGAQKAQKYIKKGKIKKSDFKKLNKKYNLEKLNPEIFKQLSEILS